MELLKVGEPVFLKSGGPRLTIASIEGDTAHCTRYTGTKLHRESHPLATLVHASAYRPAWWPSIVRTA